jgi:hypothetical protein
MQISKLISIYQNKIEKKFVFNLNFFIVKDINLRIKELRDLYFDKNNVKMALFFNTNEANIRNYINKGLPKTEFIINVSEKLEINFDWLLTGKGTMLKSEVKSECDCNELENLKKINDLQDFKIKALDQEILDLKKVLKV